MGQGLVSRDGRRLVVVSFAMGLVLFGCAALTGASGLTTESSSEAGVSSPPVSTPTVDAGRASLVGDSSSPDVESTPPLDGGVDADAAARGVMCGTALCPLGQHCCSNLLMRSCESSCSPGQFDIACDDPTDCGESLVCCASLAGTTIGSSVCTSACGDSMSLVCNESSVCPLGRTCQTLPLSTVRVCR